MKRLLMAASIFALLTPAVAFAQQDEHAGPKVEEMTFKGSDINANPLGPDSLDIVVLPHHGTSSFIQARQNFLPELMRSEQEL